MLRPIATLALLALVGAASPVTAATDFRRVETEVEVGDNTVTVERAVKYVDYDADPSETVPVTLSYSGSCGVAFVKLESRGPNPFTPRGVIGTLENVVGDSDGVTFDLTFDTLKKAGKAKQFGHAHMTLVLGVDSDCDPNTGDGGIDDTLSIPVKISVSTASHP